MYTMIFGELYEDKEEYKNPRRQAPVIGRKVTEKLDNKISRPAQRLLAEILSKGLAHYASDRYQTAEEMLAVIEKLTELTAPTAVYPLDLSVHTRSLLPSFCRERNSMLEAVHQKLEEQNHVFVGGIGGSGKSAISAMFVKKFSGEFDAVQIISFTSCKDVIKAVGFAGINDNDRDYKKHPDDLYADKLRYLQEKTDVRTLLIIENYTQCKDDCFKDLLKCPCRIIFNTRNTLDRTDFLPLEDVSEDEALEYFLNVSEREKEVETICEIIPYTGRNFLLMKLLALKLRNSPNISAEFVLNKLQSNDRFDKGRYSFDRFDEETQEEILREVFNISELSDDEKNLLSAMTLVPYCGIKQADFEQVLEPDIEENPIEGLVRLGWITQTGKGTEMKISLHQTISDFFARSDETKADFDKFAPLLEKILENEISNIKSSDTYNLMLHYIDIKEEVYHISNKTSDIYNALVIFLGEDTFQEILNERIAVAKFFSRRIVGESLSCAKVICEIAAFFYSYNKIQDSLKISEKALKITKQLLEEPRCEDKESIEIYQKRISTAHQYYESALLINRLSRGEKTQEIVGYYEHLADLCYDINDCDKELFFLKKALETSLFVNGKINYVTFRICKHLGLCYYNCSYNTNSLSKCRL